MDNGRLAQLPFTLGRFLGQDMTHIAMISPNLAGSCYSETLGSTSIGFQLGHNSSSNNHKRSQTRSA
jgi:hypothetical protein